MHRHFSIVIAIVVLALSANGCGDRSEGTTTTTTASPKRAETVDRPAPLPSGWSEEIDRRAGFSIGIPADWRIEPSRSGQGSVLVSSDGLVTVSVTADRTEGALRLPLDEFAARTAEALGSDVVGANRFEDLKVGKAAPFDHSYEAAAVRAVGRVGRTGVLERVLVVVARRSGRAAYVVVARENAERPSEVADRDTVKEIVRSLRGRPPA